MSPSRSLPSMPSPSLDYARVAQAFVELRGKGLCLAPPDLDILRSWRDAALPAPVLLEFLLDVAEECELEERGFPVTLKAIDTRLRHALREGRLVFAPPGEKALDPDSRCDPGYAPGAEDAPPARM